MAEILVVEDNEELAFMIELGLEQGGHHVTQTASGIEGAVRAARTRYDVALLDVDVEELSGLGAARAIAALGGAAVVVMSGRTDDWQTQALKGGATACLPKPFSLPKLLDLIATVLDGDPPNTSESLGDVRRLAEDDLARVLDLSSEALDALPYGIIRLDESGVVTAFNAYESRASGFASSTVVGRRFDEIAPCVATKRFVDDAVGASSSRARDAMLSLVFPHHGALCRVTVRTYFDPKTRQLWLFVSKRRGAGEQRATMSQSPRAAEHPRTR